MSRYEDTRLEERLEGLEDGGFALIIENLSRPNLAYFALQTNASSPVLLCMSRTAQGLAFSSRAAFVAVAASESASSRPLLFFSTPSRESR